MHLVKLVRELLSSRKEEKLEECAWKVARELYRDAVYRCVDVRELRYMKRYSPSQCMVEHMDRGKFRELLRLHDYDKEYDRRVIERAYDLYAELLKRAAVPIEDEERLFEELAESHFKAEIACYELFHEALKPLEEVVGYAGGFQGIWITHTIASAYLKADMASPGDRKSIASAVRRIIDALNKVAERCRSAAERR
jgi:hypothetical protein